MNKCKGCQYYGKPYWSIINPCDNCPRETSKVKIYLADGKWIDYKSMLQKKDEETERQMIDLTIKCYIKDKLIYKIDLKMSKDKLLKQLKENRLEYTNYKTGGTEIIYLDKFDKLDFDKDLDMLGE